ncbi:MAG: OsmC family protein [Thermoprotei archaeon]
MGTEINGIDEELLKSLLEEARRNPEFVQKINRWSARVKWIGSGFNFRSYVRNHSFIISEPSELGGPDTSPNAVEYVLSALGACYATGFVLNATKKGITIRNLEIALEGEIDNILVFLGLSNEGHPGYKKIIAKAYVDTDASEDMIKEVWEETVRTSPVGNTLARNVEVTSEIRIVR